MSHIGRKLVVIICEGGLESMLVEDVMKLGASGYTITEARGRGSRGVREAAWGPTSNIRMEIICDDAVAERIMDHARKQYSDDYAMVLFSADVQVLRGEKF